jgi:hypothetical protein
MLRRHRRHTSISVERRRGSFDELSVPRLQPRVALRLQPADAIVMSLAVGSMPAGRARCVVALRLLFGRRGAAGDKQPERQNEPANTVGHLQRRAPLHQAIPGNCADFQARERKAEPSAILLNGTSFLSTA